MYDYCYFVIEWFWITYDEKTCDWDAFLHCNLHFGNLCYDVLCIIQLLKFNFIWLFEKSGKQYFGWTVASRFVFKISTCELTYVIYIYNLYKSYVMTNNCTVHIVKRLWFWKTIKGYNESTTNYTFKKTNNEINKPCVYVHECIW